MASKHNAAKLTWQTEITYIKDPHNSTLRVAIVACIHSLGMIGDVMLRIPGFLPLHIQSQGTNSISVQHVIHSIIVQQASCMPTYIVRPGTRQGSCKYRG